MKVNQNIKNKQSDKNRNNIINILKNVIYHNRLLTVCIVFVIGGAIIFALLPPLVLERIINDLSAVHNMDFRIAGLYFLLLVIANLFDAIKEVLITIFGQRISRELRHQMCTKLSYLPASYFVLNEAGVTSSRFVNDVDTIEKLFTSGIISMLVDGCKMISIMGIIFVKSKGLGLIMLIVIPILFCLTRFVQKQMLKAQIDNRKAVGRANNHIPETIKNIRMIHTFGKEKYMEKKYDSYIINSYKAMEKSNFYDAIYSPIIITFSAIIISMMMILAALSGQVQLFFGMSVGTAVAAIAYVSKIFEPLESIGMEIQNIQSAVAGVNRINEFLDERERIPGNKKVDYQKKDFANNIDCVEFNHVYFGYEADNIVLQDKNFVIKLGENVTLTGRTGAGKSTIFKLILGLYSPNMGDVNILGIKACEIEDSQKRKIFGYVEQSFYRVEGTIKEQITLFDNTVSDEAVINAAKLVGLHKSIIEKEKGYDTICTETTFSQGQYQLLSIARAIVAEPIILLLDEITANLDSETELMVIDALKNASKERTVISISHRLYEQTGGRQINI